MAAAKNPATRKPYDKRCRPKVINALIEDKPPQPRDMVREFLSTDADLRVQLTPDRAEAILQLVSSGTTTSEAARIVGVNPGTVNARAYDDPNGFGVRIRAAREQGAPILYESMLRVAFNDDEDPRRSKLKMEALEKMAKFYDRATFGDHIRVEATHKIATVVLPEIALPALPIIEGKIIDPNSDDISEDDD